MAHGGSAPQVRHEAAVRHFEATMKIAFDKAYQRWQREAFDWQVGRVLAAADLFGISPEKITPADVMAGYVRGAVVSDSTMPKIRVDRQYGPRAGRRRVQPVERENARRTAARRTHCWWPRDSRWR
jgi:hypothetical protein